RFGTGAWGDTTALARTPMKPRSAARLWSASSRSANAESSSASVTRCLKWKSFRFAIETSVQEPAVSELGLPQFDRIDGLGGDRPDQAREVRLRGFEVIDDLPQPPAFLGAEEPRAHHLERQRREQAGGPEHPVFAEQ